MHDRPTANELVTAVCHWLEAELLPALADPRQRFQTHVALHALRMVERELPHEEEDLRSELADLERMLEVAPANPVSVAELRTTVRAANEHLCARIRKGQFDRQPMLGALIQQLRPMVERKLAVSLAR